MRRQVSVALVMLTATLVAAGCGSSSSSSSSTSSSTSTSSASTASSATAADAKVAAQVPAAVKSKGTLIVASDASYPPNEFIGKDGKTVEGMDADLAQALAGVMGLKAKVVNATFDGIIPGLAAKKYDLGMSSFTDTKVREKAVDFVTYFSAGTSFYVKAQGGPTINTLADLCGHKVAVEKGTTQAERRHGAGQEVHRGGQEGRDRLGLPRPERREPGALQRPRGRRHGRLARRRRTRSSSRTGSSRSPASPTARRPYGIAIPKGNGMAAADPCRHEGADRRRQVQGDPHQVGHRAGRDHDHPPINGATS